MLDINSLLVISFKNSFSHSVACLFILSVVSFALQKLLNFTRSHLFIFAFISFALGDRFPQNIATWNFSESPVVKTPYFQHRVRRFDPLLGN